MIYKQPIPTNLDEVFGNDYLSQNLYVFFLIRARTADGVVNRNGRISSLKRGQCYATITNLSRRFNKNERTIKKSLKILNEVHNKIQYATDEQGIVITIQSFDEEIKMQNDMQGDMRNEYRTTTERLPTKKNVQNEKKASKPASSSASGNSNSEPFSVSQEKSRDFNDPVESSIVSSPKRKPRVNLHKIAKEIDKATEGKAQAEVRDGTLFCYGKHIKKPDAYLNKIQKEANKQSSEEEEEKEEQDELLRKVK